MLALIDRTQLFVLERKTFMKPLLDEITDKELN